MAKTSLTKLRLKKLICKIELSLLNLIHFGIQSIDKHFERFPIQFISMRIFICNRATYRISKLITRKLKICSDISIQLSTIFSTHLNGLPIFFNSKNPLILQEVDGILNDKIKVYKELIVKIETPDVINSLSKRLNKIDHLSSNFKQYEDLSTVHYRYLEKYSQDLLA